VAVLKGSTSQLFAEKAVPKAKLIITESLDEAVRLVLKDKVNALIADYPFCVVSAFRHQGKGLVAGEARFTVEPLGIALPASDLLLVNWVQNFVKTLEWSGKLTRLTKRWFKDASWVKKLP
jgi:polar amino acid transport system substrate-binding protein